MPETLEWPADAEKVGRENHLKISENFWRRPRTKAWVDHYRQTEKAPHRKPMMDALRPFAPFGTALDLGCNCGVLMPMLLSLSPEAKVTGVDINMTALEEALERYPTHNWRLGSMVTVLRYFDDASFDVVVSSTTLALVPPEVVDVLLHEISRIARRAAVFQEPVAADPADEGLTETGCPEWRHCYAVRMAATGLWPMGVSQVIHEEFTPSPDRPAGIVVAQK